MRHFKSSERAFSSLQSAMTTMAEAYSEVPEKDLDKIQSLYTDLLDVFAWSLLAAKNKNACLAK